MTDYTKLVEALRKVADYINCYDCDMWGLNECDTERKSCVLRNAAAAIEELEDTVQAYKHQRDEYATSLEAAKAEMKRLEPKREGQAEEKWEDIYVVYRRIGQDFTDLMASDMTIDNAILFVKAWFQENYNDQETSIEINRQPMDYHREV